MADANVRDVVIIGGGHNGLVCAAYLAAAGLEARITWHPLFRFCVSKIK